MLFRSVNQPTNDPTPAAQATAPAKNGSIGDLT